MPDNWEEWGTNDSDQTYGGITLQNEAIRLKLTNAGAAIVSVDVPDKDGNWGNVAVSAIEHSDYLTNPSCLGATAGRFANRIAKGIFELDGKSYSLAVNNGPNHLHGGNIGFAQQVWQILEPGRDEVTFRLVSPDGQEGYPGTLSVNLTYRLDGSDIVLEYDAQTDEPTILNLTNHTYWNLAEEGRIDDHILTLSASQVLENDENVLPTGQVLDVVETPFDFQTPKPIGEDLEQTDGGYDCCFVIDDWDQSLQSVAFVFDPKSRRSMEVLTTEPGIQLYTANHFDGSQASAGREKHTSFCLECQHLPDAPNQPEFPSTVLRSNHTYSQTTIHRFGIESE